MKKVRFELSAVIIAILLLCMIMLMMGCGSVPRMPIAVKNNTLAPNAADANGLLLWLSALAIFGFGICIAAAVFLPVKRLAVSGAVGFAAMLGLSLTTNAALPYLPLVALGLGLIVLGCGIWYFRKYVLAAQAATAFGVAMTAANTEVEAQAVIDEHAVKQAALGVKSIVDGFAQKAKSA